MMTSVGADLVFIAVHDFLSFIVILAARVLASSSTAILTINQISVLTFFLNSYSIIFMAFDLFLTERMCYKDD